MCNAAVEVVLQPGTTFHSYPCSVLTTPYSDCGRVLRSAKAFMLGEAKSYGSTDLRLLRVVYAKDPVTVSAKVTTPDTLISN
jgi:hypothetical protein